MNFETIFTIFSISTFLFCFQASADCSSSLPEGSVYEDLQTKISSCKISSVEGVLNILPESYHSNFVLVHHSQSLQEASPQFPRVILFGADAKMILSFNGDSKQTKFNSIELIQFRESSKQFEARDITFGHGKPTFSGANPQICQSCHQTDLRPNWESFPLWPGIYGSQNDSLLGAEAAAFQNFLKAASKNNRYVKLKLNSQFRTLNHRFTEALVKLNTERMARKISQTKDTTAIRYALIASLGCFTIQNYSELNHYVNNAVSQNFARPLDHFFLDTLVLNHNEFLDRYAYENSIYPGSLKDPLVETYYQNARSSNPSSATLNETQLASARWLIENEAISTDAWSMQSISQGVQFFAGVPDGAKKFAEALATEYASTLDSVAIQNFLNADSPAELARACERLSELGH